MDIDIDYPSTFDPHNLFPQAVTASMVRDGQLSRHPCGQYFQSMPVDTLTSLAAIPYEEAEALGYIKIDFLHLTILDMFSTKEEIRKLMNTTPDWLLLLQPNQVEKLFQVHNHADLLAQVTPTSVQELADCIAIIRPSKTHLINSYIHQTKEGRAKIRPTLYQKPTNGKNWFKKAHAIAYALTVVLQLHLISMGKL